ncbi:MAG: hypothetical protein COU32_02765 [Candidatus Magasanikbacteria bacterium CG10_big_fil_rev_8_21_14_0_10_42_10]|uniref:Uncharacterized protein n=2 Tax=Candidatus Magasanikiibacteriota TaxID=1752731 RepID=A0A2H0TVX1_9BACT|nr:MAG: hypothetical protein COU32_02765 [Candidatus Magasanikbacteria bacterium CG10_big_fil_rev_8_21_14_0_10_42_10]PIZ94209.1 MAG: hypothetical protein COX82_01140 [Candidatus Magasanikbacteria bacterium CG_4_10_14_0_2_um_filter_41_10]
MPQVGIPLYRRAPEYGEQPPEEPGEEDVEKRGVYESPMNVPDKKDDGHAGELIDMNPKKE